VTAFIEDTVQDPPASYCERYNKTRRTWNLRALSPQEYHDRCGWMAVYKDTFDEDERAQMVSFLKAQDEPEPDRFGGAPVAEIPCPQYVRDALAALFAGGRGWDVPRQEFDR